MEGPGSGDDFAFAGWSMPYASDEIMKFKYDELFDCDALLLGRITYEGFAAAWPTMTDAGDFGERMNSMQKYVVSNTIEDAGWENSYILKGNIPETISTLKEEPGNDILVFGSGDLLRTLIEFNLVDEYRLLLYPVTLGEGKRLFRESSNMKLALEESKTFDNGVVLLRYIPERRRVSL